MFRRRSTPWSAALALLTGAGVLCLPFIPARDGAHPWLSLDWRPETEPLLVIGVLALLALSGRRLPRLLRWLIAVLLCLVALLQWADAAVRALLDRQLNLYFDLPHVPGLVGLYWDAAGPWRGALGIAAALLAVLGAVALTARVLAAIERALRRPRHAEVTLGVVVAVVAVSLIGRAALGAALLGERTGPVVVKQAALLSRAWRVLHGEDPRYAAALAAPAPAPGPLPGLEHRDVYIVFFESYGTVVLDNPRYAAVVEPALQRFAATVTEAGWHLLSDRIVSPTFGGGSWLAHGTIDSGVKLDPLLDGMITGTSRQTLARYMHAAGYRTVEIMPGLKTPEAGHAFWGFDRTVKADDFHYTGPAFGWFGIPDQYTLRYVETGEAAPGHPPLFAQIVLVSSHTPFAPVPPYVSDWSARDLYRGIPKAEWDRIRAAPDWSHLDKPYLDSVVYDLQTIGAWLARMPGDALVVILGDHQPPGLASGEREPWTVPIHVLSRDPDLLRPFRALGYVDGPVPSRQGPFKGMESFLGDYIRDFSKAAAAAASRPAAEHGTD